MKRFSMGNCPASGCQVGDCIILDKDNRKDVFIKMKPGRIDKPKRMMTRREKAAKAAEKKFQEDITKGLISGEINI